MGKEKIKPIKIFISHGKKSNALNLLKKFIEALGLNPLIVKDQASEGKDTGVKVEESLKKCEAAIILATGDDKVEGEKKCRQPRQNIIHEIGLAQQMLNNKITYLLEEGTEFPSNISLKVYERFTEDNLTEAFTAIIRDLREFALLSPHNCVKVRISGATSEREKMADLVNKSSLSCKPQKSKNHDTYYIKDFDKQYIDRKFQGILDNAKPSPEIKLKIL